MAYTEAQKSRMGNRLLKIFKAGDNEASKRYVAIIRLEKCLDWVAVYENGNWSNNRRWVVQHKRITGEDPVSVRVDNTFSLFK